MLGEEDAVALPQEDLLCVRLCVLGKLREGLVARLRAAIEWHTRAAVPLTSPRTGTHHQRPNTLARPPSTATAAAAATATAAGARVRCASSCICVRKYFHAVRAGIRKNAPCKSLMCVELTYISRW